MEMIMMEMNPTELKI